MSSRRVARQILEKAKQVKQVKIPFRRVGGRRTINSGPCHRTFNWFDEWSWGHFAYLPLSTTAPSWRRIGLVAPKAGSLCTSLGNPAAVFYKDDVRVHVYHHNIAGDADGQGIIHWVSTPNGWETLPYTKVAKVLALGAAGADDDSYLLCPRVMIDYYEVNPLRRFKMYYEGFDGANYWLLWASSPDGYIWTKQGRCTLAGAVPYARFSLTPVRLGQIYLGYYCSNIAGLWQTYLAYSANGVAWTYSKQVIPVGAALAWDDNTAVYPSSMYLFGCHYILYSGRNNATGKYRMGLAMSTDAVFGTSGAVTYTKWFLNPTFENVLFVDGQILQGWLFGFNDTIYCICNENVIGDIGNYQIALYKIV